MGRPMSSACSSALVLDVIEFKPHGIQPSTPPTSSLRQSSWKCLARSLYPVLSVTECAQELRLAGHQGRHLAKGQLDHGELSKQLPLPWYGHQCPDRDMPPRSYELSSSGVLFSTFNDQVKSWRTSALCGAFSAASARHSLSTRIKMLPCRQ